MQLPLESVALYALKLAYESEGSSPSYGYAQAQPPAWRDFEASMGSSGSRDNFADANWSINSWEA